MQCPLCGVSIPPETMVCPGCGTDLTVLFTVQTLQLDLQRARDQSASVAVQLDHLQGQLDAFATLVQTNLTQRRPAPPLASVPVGDAAAVPSDPSPIPPELPPEMPPPTMEPPPAVMTDGAELQFGQKWLLIAGVAITVLGIGFFLKYAFDQNWVGPGGRIILGYLAAVAFFGVGDIFRRRSGAAAFGLYLTGGGLATLYLTTYAAFQLYELFSQVSAFGVMVLVTILACLLALVYDTQWLAVLGLVGGFLTPVILSTGQSAQVILMSYMVLLNGGILTIAAWKRWKILNTLGFICTWLLFAGWFANHYTAAAFWSTLVFLHLFFLIYAFVPFIYYFVHASSEHLTGSLLTSLNTLVTFSYAFGMVWAYTSLPAVSVVALAYAGLFFGMASFLYRRHPENLEPFILLLAKGLLFLIVAIPLLFSGHWITVFWSVQMAVILWAGLRLHNRWLCYGAIVLLLLAVGKFILYDYGEVFAFRLETFAYARDFAELLLERWSTMAFVLGALLYSAHMLRTAAPILEPWQPGVTTWLYGAFAVLLFCVLTLEVSAYFYAQAPQARFAAISVLWTLFSIALMFLGFRYQQARLRLVSLGLFGVTILKVFLADMARVSTPFRIVSFVVLGLMLIGASYLYYRYRGYLLPTPPAEEQL